jgi:hypothetical protein
LSGEASAAEGAMPAKMIVSASTVGASLIVYLIAVLSKWFDGVSE